MRRTVDAALRAVAAPLLVERALQASDVAGFLSGGALVLIAAGKAARPMAETVAARCRIERGVVSAPGGQRGRRAGLDWFAGGHPLPTGESVAAAERALELARSVAPSERLLVLLSGGASAALALPAADMSLADKIRVTSALLGAGAEIHALNAVRKHLSAIKGGRLAVASAGPVLTLAISDVVAPRPDDPSAIASGPTVGDPSTFQEALAAVDRLVGRASLPASVRSVLERGAIGALPESPKPGDARLEASSWRLIGNRHAAMEGARETAERLGYRVVVLDDAVTGEAREAGRRHAERVCALAAGTPGRLCIVSSGETTVRVTGRGRGGRNQEFAVGFALGLTPTRPLALASIGTDGIDGPTDAAGAVADTETLSRARTLDVSAEDALRENDTYRFFDRLGDLVRTGPTDTNVGDLQIVLVG